jgi:hypothetical protein
MALGMLQSLRKWRDAAGRDLRPSECHRLAECARQRYSGLNVSWCRQPEDHRYSRWNLGAVMSRRRATSMTNPTAIAAIISIAVTGMHNAQPGLLLKAGHRRAYEQ